MAGIRDRDFLTACARLASCLNLSAAAARQLDQLNLKPRVRHPQLRPAPPDLLESEGRQLL